MKVEVQAKGYEFQKNRNPMGLRNTYGLSTDLTGDAKKLGTKRATQVFSPTREIKRSPLRVRSI